jgi:hypothetical protein
MKTQNSTLMGTTFNCLYSNAQNNPQTDFIWTSLVKTFFIGTLNVYSWK